MSGQRRHHGSDGTTTAAAAAAAASLSSHNNNNKNHDRCSIIRKRPVSFGNPALGTYHGNIYTLEVEEDFDTTAAAAVNSDNVGMSSSAAAGAGVVSTVNDCESNAISGNNQRGSSGSSGSSQQSTTTTTLMEAGDNNNLLLVAMVDVPPEQVPEGILNLARSHRPWINHVRIVIAEKEPTVMMIQEDREKDGNMGTVNEAGDENNDKKEEVEKSWGGESNSSFVLITEPYPNISAAENAASILATEQNSLQQQHQQQQQISEEHEHHRQILVNNNNDSSNDKKSSTITGSTNKEHEQCNNYERTYVVLLELCSDEATRQLIQDLHHKPYTSLDETQVCSIYPVVALQGTDGVSLQSPFFASSSSSSSSTTPPPASNANDATTTTATTSHHQHHHSHHLNHHQEDYNCPVCLERMELNNDSSSKDSQGNNNATTTTTATNSIFTTVCNHSFHLDCLLKWQDSPCPVCRFDHSGLNEALSQCHVCGTTENNYVCLICGVVSCGGNTMNANATTNTAASTNSDAFYHPNSNNSNGGVSGNVTGTAEGQLLSHARQHYDETLHTYALDTHTQHVWDFCGQGYVHRLLQNKEDGKLVEVTDPFNTTSQERSLNPGLSEAQEGEVVHRKLEGMASAYYTLLKSQLEQQRIFYEGRLEEIRRDYNETASSQNTGRGSGGCGQRRKKNAPDLIAALKQERHQLSQRLVLLQSRRNKVKEDASFLISMNESLEKNKDFFRNQVVQAQQQRQEVRRMLEECLPPLQEKVTRLMLQLESEISSSQQQQQPAAAKESSEKLPGNRK